MMTLRSSKESDERPREVLKAIVREYVRSGKPVGSHRLSKAYREGLSPATLRNVMADLEDMGLVTQPHTSAGRIPTAAGYRFYVDSIDCTGKLPNRQAAQIKQSLEPETDPGELMNKTSQVLSALSDNVGFVLAPPISTATMKHIKFIRRSRQRILVILVTGSGLVQHRFLQMDQDFAQSELDQAGRYLVAHFEGQTLLEIRAELVGRAVHLRHVEVCVSRYPCLTYSLVDQVDRACQGLVSPADSAGGPILGVDGTCYFFWHKIHYLTLTFGRWHARCPGSTHEESLRLQSP